MRTHGAGLATAVFIAVAIAGSFLVSLASAANNGWVVGGSPISPSDSAQDAATIVPDGAGGAFVSWQDRRSGQNVPYAQHLTSLGSIASGWPPAALSLPVAGFNDLHPVVIPDGAGGLYLASDRGDDHGHIDLVRLTGAGAAAPGWFANGLRIPGMTAMEPPAGISPTAITGTGPGDVLPSLSADGFGGVLISWSSIPYRMEWNARVARITSSGALSPGWGVWGLGLRPSWDAQYPTVVCNDGSGGAFVAWRNLSQFGNGIYLHHALASGALDSRWPTYGMLLNTEPLLSDAPGIVPDGTGGAIVVWQDRRNGLYERPFAQHVLNDGSLSVGWPAGGMELSSFQAAPGIERAFYTSQIHCSSIVADGSGGAIVAWTDYRDGSGEGDVYAQRVRGNGTVAPGWPVNGNPICSLQGRQELPVLTTDGAGGAWIAWQDARGGTLHDIYETRVDAAGVVAEPHAVCTAPGDQRSPAICGDGAGGTLVTWEDSRGATPNVYMAHVPGSGVSVVDPTPTSSRLDGMRPNPALGRFAIDYSLADASPAVLEVLDVMGRSVFSSIVGTQGAGPHRFDLGSGSRFAPGLYLIRLRQGGRVYSSRGVVLR